MSVLFIIAGLVIIFGGFCFDCVNTAQGASEEFVYVHRVRKHMGAAIIMGFGALIFAIGIVIAIANALSRVA